MIYNNVELFNVDETDKTERGVVLQRFSKEARADTRNRAAWMASAAMGLEIRLVTDAEVFWITLGAEDQNIDIYVMRGDYFYDKYTVNAGSLIVLRFENDNFLSGLKTVSNVESRFSPNVWRFYFHSEGKIVYGGIKLSNGSVRSPKADEVPEKKLLAYGSSITHGCWAMDSRNAYINTAGQRLAMDVYNMGMAGACRLEKSICDFLIRRDDWDIALLELGINVLYNYTAEEFGKRAEYLVTGMCKRGKPVILTGFFHSRNSMAGYDKVDEFNDVLKSIMEIHNLPNLTYIDGTEIMTSSEYLSRDLVHPSDLGHIRMGEILSNIIRENNIL